MNSAEYTNIEDKTNIPHEKVILAVPVGLEEACIGIANREYGVSGNIFSDGLIECSEGADGTISEILLNPPRWTFGSFLLASTFSECDFREEFIERTEREINLCISHIGMSGKSYWLLFQESTPKKFSKIKKVILESNRLLASNNPGDYSITIRVDGSGDCCHILVGVAISVKQRFSYRIKDLGASINPVLAACLVRLMPKELSGTAIDPTCGSGTLLIERLIYSSEIHGLGIDISPTAENAFRTNISATERANDFSFELGNSTNPMIWKKCSSVVSNLPFGIKLKDTPENLKSMYSNILSNALSNIEARGRILMTSSFKGGLEFAVKKNEKKVHVLARYKAQMGGLFYQVFVMKKK